MFISVLSALSTLCTHSDMYIDCLYRYCPGIYTCTFAYVSQLKTVQTPFLKNKSFTVKPFSYSQTVLLKLYLIFKSKLCPENRILSKKLSLGITHHLLPPRPLTFPYFRETWYKYKT